MVTRKLSKEFKGIILHFLEKKNVNLQESLKRFLMEEELIKNLVLLINISAKKQNIVLTSEKRVKIMFYLFIHFLNRPSDWFEIYKLPIVERGKTSHISIIDFVKNFKNPKKLDVRIAKALYYLYNEGDTTELLHVSLTVKNNTYFNNSLKGKFLAKFRPRKS